jgi:hypothetical protein
MVKSPARLFMGRLNIQPNKISFVSGSFTDPIGPAFEWKCAIYRAVAEPYAPFAEIFLGKELSQNLSNGTFSLKARLLTVP